MGKLLGGFQCSKYTLMGLNIFYIIVGIILISLGTQWSHSNQVTSLPIVGGVVACGVFLIVISILGIFGASRHHQVLLFFYMLILFIVFIIQFSVACACLSVSSDTQKSLATGGWNSLTNESRSGIQDSMGCCKFSEDSTVEYPLPCPHQCSTNCTSLALKVSEQCCPTCEAQILEMIDRGFQIVGGVSLFFSFTEFLGVWLTVRFRNMGPNYPNRSEPL